MMIMITMTTTIITMIIKSNNCFVTTDNYYQKTNWTGEHYIYKHTHPTTLSLS